MHDPRFLPRYPVTRGITGIIRRTHALVRALTIVCFPSAGNAGPLLTNQHIDISVANGTSPALRWFNADTATFFALAVARGYIDPIKSARIRPAGSQWDFLGMAASEPLYLLTSTQRPGLLYLGFGAEHASLDAFQAWNPGDPARAVNSNGKWLQVLLTGCRGPGQFSVYTVVGGQPRIWMATSDGISPSNTADSLYVPEGGHAHYNFAFSKAGTYQLEIKIRAMQGGQFVDSSGTLMFTTEQSLGITRTASGSMELSWPSLSAGFVLQENPGLDPSGWAISPHVPVDDGQWNKVIVSPNPPRRFFRLAKP